MDCSTPGFPVHYHLLEFSQTHVHWVVVPFNHLILYHCLLLPPSIFPSIRVFSSESALCIRWPKYWRFSVSPSIEYSGLIPFRIGWLDLLAVQETLKGLPQHHSSKASILWCLAFFVVQMEDKKIKEMTRAYVTCWIPSDGSAYISWELQMEKRKSTWRYNGQNLPKFV